MRAVVIQGSFGLENLALVERPAPQTGPGQVRVGVRAGSLNYRDLLMVTGRYNPRQTLPLVPLSDGAGEVLEVGEGVTSAKVGDRVAGTFAQGWESGPPTRARIRSTLGGPLDGMLAEEIVLDAGGVVPIPDSLSFEEAATLPCAALTAFNALLKYETLRAGQRVLLLGTGGVSIFALQFAKALGATVAITSGSDPKLERARALGADHGVNYTQDPHWGKSVKAWSGGEGVDIVLEVGGSGTLANSLASVRVGGMIVLIGILSGPGQTPDLTPAFMNCIRIQGHFVGNREDFLAMNRSLSTHPIRPQIDRVFDLADARAAFEHLREGRHFGKVVIRL